MTIKKIAVFTGNRAEYGLLYPLLKELNEREEVDLKLIVSGAHLDSNFGDTREEIKNDGFQIAAEVKINLSKDSLGATANAIGTGVISMVKALDRIKPDMLVVYADRFEGFSAVVAASQSGLPVAHVEGGDITEGGALDDSVRHAMSKLSHLHFTTNNQATNRLLSMGEEKWRVHTVGFVDHDLIEMGRLTKPNDLEEKYNLNLTKPILIFTQHSVALSYELVEEQLFPSLDALERIANDDVQVMVTYPNNDAGGRKIISLLEAWNRRGLNKNISIYKSLGQPNYHGILSLSKTQEYRVACGGNSSSGIKETPIFGCPAIDIGTRQNGRLRADNVINVNYNSDEIYNAFKKSLFDSKFREKCRNIKSPYSHGKVGEKITEVLINTPFDHKLLLKKMCIEGLENDGWYR